MFSTLSLPTPNVVTKAPKTDNFYISYNNVDGDIYGSDTTALVLGQMEHFYILNGDHQRAYKDLLPQGLEACLTYFRENAALINKRSDTPPPAGTPHPEPKYRM